MAGALVLLTVAISQISIAGATTGAGVGTMWLVRATDDEAISVVHNAQKRRYELRDGDVVAGFTQYRLPDDVHVDFTHTEVDAAYNGRGLASKLVEFALQDVQQDGKRIIPHCPYVAVWIKRHRGVFDDITDWPERGA